MVSNYWLSNFRPIALLHLVKVVGDLELGTGVLLHLLDGHARGNLGEGKTSVLTVDLEDTLLHFH